MEDKSSKADHRVEARQEVIVKDEFSGFAKGLHGVVKCISNKGHAIIAFEGFDTWQGVLQCDFHKLEKMATNYIRPTVGDRVVVQDTDHAKRHCPDLIDTSAKIDIDDQSAAPYKIQGCDTVWFGESMVSLVCTAAEEAADAAEEANKAQEELAQASERDKAKKSVGFAIVTGESDRTVAAAVTGGSEKKGPDSPALASETKAEEYKYDPDEKGETWDIYKQRAADKSMAARKSEDAVLIKSKADAAIRAAEVAAACADASQGFVDQASVGRKTRGRTAIFAVDSLQIPEEQKGKEDEDEDEEDEEDEELKRNLEQARNTAK